MHRLNWALHCSRAAAGNAQQSTDLPESVVDLLVGVRDYLQDKCEPPVYVSDRRFMKAIQLLQVAAHTDGRDEVTAFSSKRVFDLLVLKKIEPFWTISFWDFKQGKACQKDSYSIHFQSTILQIETRILQEHWKVSCKVSKITTELFCKAPALSR